MDPREQLAAEEIHRLLELPLRYGGLELRDVTGQAGRIDRQRLVTARNECVVADRLAQMIQSVSERSPRRELVEVRPEHRRQRIPPVVAVAATDGEIGKERKSLGLRDERSELATIRVAGRVQAEKS